MKYLRICLASLCGYILNTSLERVEPKVSKLDSIVNTLTSILLFVCKLSCRKNPILYFFFFTTISIFYSFCQDIYFFSLSYVFLFIWFIDISFFLVGGLDSIFFRTWFLDPSLRTARGTQDMDKGATPIVRLRVGFLSVKHRKMIPRPKATKLLKQ